MRCDLIVRGGAVMRATGTVADIGVRAGRATAIDNVRAENGGMLGRYRTLDRD